MPEWIFKKNIKYPKELQHLNASQLGFAILSLYSIFYGYRGSGL